MKTYLDCYPCFLNQTLGAARLANMEEAQQYRALHDVLNELSRFEPTATAPEMAYHIHRIVRLHAQTADPYQAAKVQSTRQSLALYPRLKALVESASDPLEIAIRLSIAGNIIDLGVSHEYDLEETIERVLKEPFAVECFTLFREALEKTDEILYLADNAGETVFDRILIETVTKPVTYVVKKAPIINDATKEDALAAGLNTVSAIIDNGSQAPGTVLHLCSDAFRHRFESATMIIAKGQANYECLSEINAPVFFLLQAKCPLIARHLGVSTKGIVFKAAETYFCRDNSEEKVNDDAQA